MKSSGGRRSCPQSRERNIYNCNNCDFVSENKSFLTNHVEKTHKEKLSQNNSISDKTTSKRPCAYFNSPKGCKKGDNCDWDHSEEAQVQSVTKVSTLCRYKEACRWKPRCRFVHPEDGESVARGSASGPGSPAQGFVNPDLGTQPPGWNHLPPPASNSSEQLIQQIQQQLQQINLMCLTQFPNLGMKKGQ